MYFLLSKSILVNLVFINRNNIKIYIGSKYFITIIKALMENITIKFSNKLRLFSFDNMYIKKKPIIEVRQNKYKLSKIIFDSLIKYPPPTK